MCTSTHTRAYTCIYNRNYNNDAEGEGGKGSSGGAAHGGAEAAEKVRMSLSISDVNQLTCSLQIMIKTCQSFQDFTNIHNSHV